MVKILSALKVTPQKNFVLDYIPQYPFLDSLSPG